MRDGFNGTFQLNIATTIIIVEEQWKVIKEAVTSSCQQVLDSKKYTHKDWITTDTLEKIDERKNRKAALNNSRTLHIVHGEQEHQGHV